MSTKRADFVSRLSSSLVFDLVIIGGGVTGAGIALDATLRGLNVCLVEKDDFASGTSSRSTKLIHGGLRYLKQMEFALVAEVGRERAVVHDIATHLVIPEKLMMPLVVNGSYGRISTSLGLTIYDLLAGVKKKDKKIMLSPKKAIKKEPLLDDESLIGAAYYAEYRTDDARLTISLIKTAIHHGATCLNYCEVVDFEVNNGLVCGVHCLNLNDGSKINISAKYVVSATGPWVDTMSQLSKTPYKKKLHLTKGVHIVLPHNKMPLRQSIYFDIPDGRMLFAIPRGERTYIGTTDTDYNGNINEVFAIKEDVEYIINAVNQSFSKVELTISDIESSWAGLRPLIYQEGKSASELSRKDEIFISEDGLISIAGGKLTGYRKMAEKIVDLVVDKIEDNRIFNSCKTAKTDLLGNSFSSYEDVKLYIQKLHQEYSSSEISLADIQYLVHTYGDHTTIILESLKKKELELNKENLILAELDFTVLHEMVCNSSDFFIRRTGRLYFNIKSVNDFKEIISNKLKEIFNWSDKEQLLDLEQLNKSINNTTKFKN